MHQKTLIEILCGEYQSLQKIRRVEGGEKYVRSVLEGGSKTKLQNVAKFFCSNFQQIFVLLLTPMTLESFDL